VGMQSVEQADGMGRGAASIGGVAQDTDDFPDVLTKREKEIVQLVLQGKGNAEIAAEIFLSEATVKKHLHTVYRKLNLRNRKYLLRHFLSR